jgi:hexosaminidase
MLQRLGKVLANGLGLFALVLCAPMASAQTRQALIPMPREYHDAGMIHLERGLAIVCEPCDAADRFASNDLRAILSERGVRLVVAAPVKIRFLRADTRSAAAILSAHDLSWSREMDREGYAVVPDRGGLVIIGATPEGIFYGAQTVKQMLDPVEHSLRAATIRDWPALQIRGLSDDLSRGPVPILAFMKKQIRTFAAYKMNLYSPYFENTLQYASNPLIAATEGSLSVSEARELVAYAKDFHVEIAPEQEAFGHLHNVLKLEQYASLGETPHGQVLAPGQPGSLTLAKQMFAELASIFPGRYLHLGADETDELGKGQSNAEVAARGLGAVYLDSLQKIVTELEPLHRKLLFWGDVAMHDPQLVRALPADFKRATIAVPWEYNAHPEGFRKFIAPFTDAGIECWVAPGMNNWSRVYPNFNVALENIQGFTAAGQASGCTGQLNAVWNDDGEGLFNANWYGVLFGAASAWQAGTSPIPAFQGAYGRAFHGDTSGKIDQAQRELMAVHALLTEKYKRSDVSDSLFWVDPWSVDGQRFAPQLRPYLSELRIHAENALALIREARLARKLREPDALDAMELAARRIDFLGLKFQTSDEMAEIYDLAWKTHSGSGTGRAEAGRALDVLNSTNGKLQDMRDGYSSTRDLYETAWLKSYRPFWLRNHIDRYDMSVQLWLGRIDRMRSTQRQLAADRTLPTAAEMGIPAPWRTPRP